MGLLGKVVSAVGAVVLLVVGLGAYLWFTDYAVQATVTDRGSDEGGNYVVVTPKLYGYDYKKYLSGGAYDYVCVGYQVEFHVQTQQYRVYDADGSLVYDSQQGLVDAGSALRCRVSNDSGGILG